MPRQEMDTIGYSYRGGKSVGGRQYHLSVNPVIMNHFHENADLVARLHALSPTLAVPAAAHDNMTKSTN